MNVENSYDRIQVGRRKHARMGRGREEAPVTKISTKVNVNKHQISHNRITD